MPSLRRKSNRSNRSKSLRRRSNRSKSLRRRSNRSISLRRKSNRSKSLRGGSPASRFHTEMFKATVDVSSGKPLTNYEQTYNTGHLYKTSGGGRKK